MAYHWYKAWSEASHVQALQAVVQPRTTVVDVGANVGFYTRRFAQWVQPGGEVIALEPEAANFASLERMILRRGLRNVKAIRAVAAEVSGTLKLQLNPFNPADHRISSSGIEIPALRLDDLLLRGDRLPVSLIKIDVQGAEERVLTGTTVVLNKLRPALFIEVDEAALVSMDSSAERLLHFIHSRDYQIARLKNGHPEPIGLRDALSLCTRGSYVDLLFRPLG